MSAAFAYFWAKVYLSAAGSIRLYGAMNLALLGLLYATWEWASKPSCPRGLAPARTALGAAAALWLLWCESWLPSPQAAYEMLSAWGLPSGEYIADFLFRFFRPRETAILAVCVAAGFLLRKRVRALSLVTAVLLTAASWLPAGVRSRPAGLDEHLARFYEGESKRLMPFKTPENADSPLDVILLSVCSLSWQDLRDAGLVEHPLFSEFDYLFTAFNSVSTYSNPSVIRLLTANRGQVRHAELYEGAPGVALVGSMENLGYAPLFAMNHDGRYGKFLEETRRFGGAGGRVVVPEGLAPILRMFDDSPVFRDYDALKLAWDRRLADKNERVLLFHNSVTLHDGNYRPEDRDSWKKEPVESYQAGLRGLLDDTARFIRLVESSGRRAVIFFVPEHGRSLHGSPMQVAGLRDIPLPEITRVPVGVKLVGERAYPHRPRQQVLAEPASYFAIAYMASVFIEKNPFLKQGFDSVEFLRSVPRTDFVAENDANVVVYFQGRHWLRGRDRPWTAVAGENAS